MHPLVALAALLWLITAIAGVAACVSFGRAVRLTGRGAQTAGRIVAQKIDSESSSVAAVVEYVVMGVAYRVETNVYVAPEQIPLGAPRRVVYLPNDPRRAEVAGANRYVKVIVFSSVTLAVGAAAGGLSYLLWA
jgi:hypothetical protein